jgi:anti-sigma B factor antagonist
MPRMATPVFQAAGRPAANPRIHILQVQGAITHTTAPAFQEAVSATGGSPRLIIDLSEVPSVDSMAVGALVRAYVFCNKAGRKLALVGLNHRVANVLRLTGVDSLFDTYASVREAESALST